MMACGKKMIFRFLILEKASLMETESEKTNPRLLNLLSKVEYTVIVRDHNLSPLLNYLCNEKT